MTNLAEIQSIITKIELKSPQKLTFNDFKQSNRFPYTYAWDYVREHHEDFGFDSAPSRAEAGWFYQTALNTDAAIETAAVMLAEAYYREFYR